MTGFNEAAFYQTRKVGSYDEGRFTDPQNRFNEAAFYQTRKDADTHRHIVEPSGFNEAAFYQTRKGLPSR